MRFGRTAEQRAFGQALGDLLSSAQVPAATRAWAAGDVAPGLTLWSSLAEVGLTALRVPEEQGGVGGNPVDLMVAFDQLGYHAVPGPWLETVALAPGLLVAARDPDNVLPGVCAGTGRVSLAAPPLAPYALDAEVADHVYVVTGTELARAASASPLESVDRSRRLARVEVGEVLATLDAAAVTTSLDEAVLAASAQLLGAGRRLLDESVSYAGTRQQFGRAIGQYQAVKHALADVRVGLDFAAPLLHGAAESLTRSASRASLTVSAAKAACTTAAYRAARTALQVHGAIGYTEEFDLSLWLTKVRALVGAWGGPAWHRQRVLDLLDPAA